MADEPETPPPGKKKGSGLSGSWHGVPKPVLLLGGGLALYLGYRWYKNRQSSSSTTTPSTTSTGNTTGTGTDTTGAYGTGGGYGGGAGGGTTTPDSGAPVPTVGSVPWNNGIDPSTGLPWSGLGVIGTLAPQPTSPGSTQLPYGTVVANPGGGTDQAAVTALANAKAALAKAEKSGNKKAIADATTNVGTAQSVVNTRNAASGITAASLPIAPPAASKTTPTGVAAQAAPINQALATSQANLVKSQAAEKAHPSAANAAAVKAHESQVKAGR